MASNEKYAIRLLCTKILDKMTEYDCKEMILEIANALMQDDLAITKNELVQVLTKLEKYDWFNEEVQNIVGELRKTK